MQHSRPFFSSLLRRFRCGFSLLHQGWAQTPHSQQSAPSLLCPTAQRCKRLQRRQCQQNAQRRNGCIDPALLHQPGHHQHGCTQSNSRYRAIRLDCSRFRAIKLCISGGCALVAAQDLLHLAWQLPRHQQIGLASDQIHRLRTHGFQRHGAAHSGLAAAQPLPKSNTPARQQQPGQCQQAQPPAHHAIGQCQQQSSTQRRAGGHQQAQIKVVQRVHIRSQALQQTGGPLQQHTRSLRAGPV